VRFFGEVEHAAAAALQAKLEHALSPTEVGLDLGVVGTFGSRSRPRVVWLGLTGDLDGLLALRDEIDAAATFAELEVDERPLRAHITIARVDRRATATLGRAITAAVEQLEVPRSSPFVARDVALVRSHLGARARYEVLGRYPTGVI
jgi:2'-5' RNA ligase